MSDGTSNIPQVSIGEVIEKMSRLYTVVVKEHRSFRETPAPFLWGAPGVGKSEGVKQIADNLEQTTGKTVIVTDIRLALFSPIDLRGVPVADTERTFTVWLKPKILDMDPSGEVINLLFLDELSSAPPQVQAAAYQLTLDRQIGEHKLPGNCLIMGAGNRSIDRSVTFRMPLALGNRLMHFEINADFDAWKKWAMRHHTHPYVIGYVGFDRRKLCKEELEAEQMAFPTPRSWNFVSNLLWILKDAKIEEIYTEIAACIGSSEAAEFVEWCKCQDALPDTEDIFHGRKTAYPKTPDALYAVISSIVVSAEQKERDKRLLKEELDNVAVYAAHFPEDYQTCLYSALKKTDGIKEKMGEVRLYKEWLRQMENETW